MRTIKSLPQEREKEKYRPGFLSEPAAQEIRMLWNSDFVNQVVYDRTFHGIDYAADYWARHNLPTISTRPTPLSDVIQEVLVEMIAESVAEQSPENEND